jgi:hypothetical protein
MYGGACLSCIHRSMVRSEVFNARASCFFVSNASSSKSAKLAPPDDRVGRILTALEGSFGGCSGSAAT